MKKNIIAAAQLVRKPGFLALAAPSAAVRRPLPRKRGRRYCGAFGPGTPSGAAAPRPAKRTILTDFAACLAAAMIAVSAAALPVHAEEAPTERQDTLSSIGSVSKSFAAAAIMQLADAGKLELDAPVTEYLPEFRTADSRYKDITVRMLLDHSSGILGTSSKDLILFRNFDEESHDGLLKSLSGQRLKADPGDFAAYCNDGFEIAELVVEAVSGEDFTDYVSRHICKPLGMQQTGTPKNALCTDAQVKVFQDARVPFAEDYCMDIGSGGILSTAPELCRFGSAFFIGNTVLFSDQAKQEMFRPAMAAPYEDRYGLGFDDVAPEDYEAAGVKVISKGGDIVFQHAGLVIAPEEQISVAVLSSGGSSLYNELMATALLDIALDEKGIHVEHEKPAALETLDAVPEQYLSYADTYLSATGVCQVSFPEGKYMEIANLTGKKPEIRQYLYTTEDSFVQMEGLIASGKAVQSADQTVLHFRKRNGTDYIVSDSCMQIGSSGIYKSASYLMQRTGTPKVSDAAQAAWDARNGRKYYVYNCKYSSVNYAESPAYTVQTYPEARGYVNTSVIVDETHLQQSLSMPGGRDLQDIAVRQENGTELLTVTNSGMEMLSEDAIPALDSSQTEVALHTEHAAWYRISDAESQTVTLEIPEHAAVYVYDAFDHMTYSSYMLNYGSTVPLPAGGKIVFLGEDGGTVHISQ